MSDSVAVFLNSLPGIYGSLTPEQKRSLEDSVKKWLTSEFQRSLDDKVTRAFETSWFGPLPLVHQFVQFMPGLFDLYVNGFYHAAVALAGLTAERLCYDLIEVSNLQVDGKSLSNNEKQLIEKMRWYDLIELLAQWSLIQKSTRQSLHEIREIRNRYVHPRQLTPENAKGDAKRIITVLCEVARSEFGPSATGRYTIEQGKLTVRKTI
jgi:hypothetical protein